MHFKDSISQRRQAAKQRDFLTHFALSGNVRTSAKQAGVSRALVYWWKDNFPTFADKLSVAAGEAFGETLAGSQQSGGKAAPDCPGRKVERSAP